MAIFTLDRMGVVLAFVFGALLWFLGLGIGYFMVLESIVFIVVAALATDFGTAYKKRVGTYQRDRGVRNVLANGLAPLFMAVGFFLSTNYLPVSHLNLLFLVGFIGSVAAVTADKFGSEIGVFGGRPVMIFGWRRVRIGTSGGVTLLGLGAGLVASAIMAAPAITVAKFVVASYLPVGYGTLVHGPSLWFSIPMFALYASVIAGGFIGNVMDSALGYFEEKGTGNKYTSNFFSSVIGGIVAVGLFWLIAAL